MSVAIVRYNAGNVRSVEFALRRLGVEPILTDDAAALRAADRVIFPGVGEASSAMRYLRERGLDDVIRSLTQPVLGICLGLQLLCAHSEENNTDCLGIFPNHVKRFPKTLLKVPQIGWNTVQHDGQGVFEGLPDDPYMYFVHSFAAEVPDGTTPAAVTDYGVPFASALRAGNFHAVQFHPEKSADTGAALLKTFLAI